MHLHAWLTLRVTRSVDPTPLFPPGRFVRVRDCVCVFDFWNGKIQQTLLVWPQSNLLKQLSQEPTVAIKGPTTSGDMESSPKLRGP